MKTTVLKNTKENTAKVEALKTVQNTVGKIFWIGTTIHDNLDKCLVALNLNSTNSGHYKPTAVRIIGLNGIYMINQDGSLFCEARIIKQGENKYLIEYMTNEGWNEFEKLYVQNDTIIRLFETLNKMSIPILNINRLY